MYVIVTFMFIENCLKSKCCKRELQDHMFIDKNPEIDGPETPFSIRLPFGRGLFYRLSF